MKRTRPVLLGLLTGLCFHIDWRPPYYEAVGYFQVRFRPLRLNVTHIWHAKGFADKYPSELIIEQTYQDILNYKN